MNFLGFGFFYHFSDRIAPEYRTEVYESAHSSFYESCDEEMIDEKTAITFPLTSVVSGPSTDEEYEESLLPSLLKDENLFQLYQKSAGVSEGYTVLEHTKMVLDIALCYKEQFRKSIEPICSWREFLFFLALHDIGKGRALEEEREFSGNPISFKAKELKYTREILEDVCKQAGLDKKSVRLFHALLLFDAQGQYLQNSISKKACFEYVLMMSAAAGVKPHLFYKLLEAFHRIDSASYPSLFSAIYEEREGTLHHIAKNANLVHAMKEEVELVKKGETELTKLLEQSSESRQEEEIIEASKALLAFLKYVHHTLHAAKKMQEDDPSYFKGVKKSYEALFMVLIQEIPEIKPLYFHVSENRFPFSFDHKLTYLVGCIREMAEFRRSYLSYFHMAKVERYVQNKCLLQPVGSHQAQPLSLKHENYTFLHGSNSSVLPSLLFTDFQLVPSGMLFKAGVIPLSGELRAGFTKSGVNQYWLSGTTPASASIAIAYAETKVFKIDMQKLKEKVESLIDTFGKDRISREIDSYSIFLCGSFNYSLSSSKLAIGRLRLLDPPFVESIKDTLSKTLIDLQCELESYKESKEYKHIMVEQGNTYCEIMRKQGYQHLAIFEEECADLLRILDMPLVRPKGIEEAINNPYPIVFASSSRPAAFIADPAVSEIHSLALRLGEDIQTVFVPETAMESMQAFLDEHRLTNVTVDSITNLKEAMEVSKLAQSYLMRAIPLHRIHGSKAD